MTRTETTRRQSSALAIGWILTLLAGLRPGRGSEASAQQRPVVVVQSGEAATLDWHMHCDKNAHEPDRQIFDTLLRRNLKTLQLEGNLAESWRLLNDTTWQFKLRRNVKFHNGEPFDADAVKFSIERMLDPKQAAPGRTSIATIDRVEVVDPLTVNVITKAPFPLLPVRMSPGHCGTVGIVPPKYVAQVGDAGFAVKPVGTGPLQVRRVGEGRAARPGGQQGLPSRRPGDRPAGVPPDAGADDAGGGPPLRPGGPRQRHAARPGRQGQGERSRPDGGLHPGRLRHHDEDHQPPDAGAVAGRARPKGHEPRHRHAHDRQDRARGLRGHPGRPAGERSLRVQPQHQVVRLRSRARQDAPPRGGPPERLRADAPRPEPAVHERHRGGPGDGPDARARWASRPRSRWASRASTRPSGGSASSCPSTWSPGAAPASSTATSWSTRSTRSRRWRSTRTRPSTRSWKRRRARTTPRSGRRSISRRRRSIYEDAPIITAYQQAHIFGISNRLDWTPWIDNMLFLYDAKLK